MIGPKEAVKKAMDVAHELFGSGPLDFLRLEELSLSEDGKFWNVTLGWVEPALVMRTVGGGLFGGGGEGIAKKPRVYKVFKLDATSGDLFAITIRNA